MKVQMVTLAAGPEGVYPAGAVVDVPEAQAIAWIEGGYATPAREERETATVEPAETAVVVTKKKGRAGARRSQAR